MKQRGDSEKYFQEGLKSEDPHQYFSGSFMKHFNELSTPEVVKYARLSSAKLISKEDYKLGVEILERALHRVENSEKSKGKDFPSIKESLYKEIAKYASQGIKPDEFIGENTPRHSWSDENYELSRKAIHYLEKTGQHKKAEEIERLRGEATNTSWRKRKTLEEKATATASIVGVLGGIFFLSSNITGNAIANVSQSSGNILGAVLLVVGLVAGFFWVKKK
jgi:hypothetical protein